MDFSFKAMWNYKCPRCREGDLFIKPMNISKPLDMPKRCDVCNQRTEPEPGFYFGAMFASYIISSWLLLLPTLLLVFYFGWSIAPAMAFALFLGALSYIRLLRGSRSLWIHLMVKYDPSVLNTPNLNKDNIID